MDKLDISIIIKAVDALTAPIKKMVGSLGNFSQSLNKIRDKMKAVSEQATRLGSDLTLKITTPLIAAGAMAVKYASDMNETMNKIDVSFGSSASVVKQWSKTSIQKMGLAGQTALDSAALYGDMATSMDFSRDKAAAMSMTLTQLGADLASFKNVSNEQAQTALKGIFTGETESLKMLGYVMTEDTLKRFAATQGIKKKISAMSQEEKVMLRYNFILEKTKNAQGDFARTSKGAANQQKMLVENTKENARLFGEIILPTYNKVLVVINGMMSSLQGLSQHNRTVVITLAAIAASIGPVVLGIGLLASSIVKAHEAFTLIKSWAIWTKMQTMAQSILNGVQATYNGLLTGGAVAGRAFWAAVTGPIGIAVGVVTVLIGLGVLLYKKWKPFRDLVNQIGSSLASFGKNIGQAFGFGAPKPLAGSPPKKGKPLPEHHTGLWNSPDEHLAVIKEEESVLTPKQTKKVNNVMNSGAGIQLTYSPVVNVGAGANIGDFKAMLKQHSKEIEKIVDNAQRNKMRLAY